jgi:7-cyano-7-deazaguanine reductase
MDAIQRRELLKPSANPGGARDYMITLRVGQLHIRPDGASVVLRYVPDRLILEPPDFEAYTLEIGKLEWDSVEAVAVAILDDIANQLVPRWAQVTLRAKGPSGHEIAIEESQPGWRNEDLIYRLPPV